MLPLPYAGMTRIRFEGSPYLPARLSVKHSPSVLLFGCRAVKLAAAIGDVNFFSSPVFLFSRCFIHCFRLYFASPKRRE